MELKKRKILSIFMCLFVLMSSVLIGCKNSEENTDTIAGLTVANQTVGNQEENTDTTASSTVENKEDEHNQTGVSVNGIKVSWANMKIDNENLSLTDDQKTVLQYFDDDYLYIADYDSLQRYPEIFRQAQVEFQGSVVKILETNDESYQCLVWLADIQYLLTHEFDYKKPPEDNFIVVTGKHPSTGRIIEGDYLRFYGRYNDVESHTIDGKEAYYPTISSFYTVAGDKFDADYIKKTAKILFGPDLKLSDPMSSSDYTLDMYHWNGYSYYLVTLDNQTNANFSSFEFSRTNGFIRDANIKEGVVRTISISADFTHYIIIIRDTNLNTVYVEYFDREFKKIWSREFEDTNNMEMDYTMDKMFLVTDNDLYYLDINTGEDVIPSVFVGKKIAVNLLDDGAILIGEGSKDNVMKVDFEGNIVWKTSIDLDVESCTSLQIIDGNVIGYVYGAENFAQKMFCVDKDGNLVSEFECQNYELVL